MSFGADALLCLPLAFALSALVLLWLFYDISEGTQRDRFILKNAFHCVCCQHIYLGNMEKGKCPCPSCGFPNISLRF